MISPSLQELAALEAQRAIRSGRWFSLLRFAPAGWLALDCELDMLEVVVRSHLRRTDAVCRVGAREVAVVLVECVGDTALAPLARLKQAIQDHMVEVEVRSGWASVGPGQQATWQEAWRWAGQLLVADAAVPAAA